MKLIKPKIIFSDVDDTLTYKGLLPSEALESLYKLQSQKIKVILVTGACAGWCDQFARLWPIAAVIGENGAFVIKKDNNKLIYQDTQTCSDRKKNLSKIKQIAKDIFIAFPNLKPAKDNIYRRYDYAIDYNQEITGFNESNIKKIIKICNDNNINATTSSIHINMWIGNFNKLTAAKNWIAENTDFNEEDIQKNCSYIGDSLNDEVMFKFFQNSIGVANIKPHLKNLKYKPTLIMSKEGGFGFAEWSKQILNSKY